MNCAECEKEFINPYEYISIHYADNRNNVKEKQYHIACFMDCIKEVTKVEIELDKNSKLTFDVSDKIDDFFNYHVLDKPIPPMESIMDSYPC